MKVLLINVLLLSLRLSTLKVMPDCDIYVYTFYTVTLHPQIFPASGFVIYMFNPIVYISIYQTCKSMPFQTCMSMKWHQLTTY